MEKVCSGIRLYKIYAFNKNVLSAYSVPDLVRVFRYLSNNLQYGQSVHLCDFFSQAELRSPDIQKDSCGITQD